jgi:SAM-dependent MidA family methyltransferase
MSALPTPSAEALAHSEQLRALILRDIEAQGGWIPFSRFMELALYAPGLGYYTAGARKFGATGDFVTAPELSPLFGRALARQAAEIMARSTPHILELGAGSGKLAVDLLRELERMNALPQRYAILEVSADLRERQQTLLQACVPHLMDRMDWFDALPEKISGAVIGNEVLDALPVHLVRWQASRATGAGGSEEDLAHFGIPPFVPILSVEAEKEPALLERGVAVAGESFMWEERPIGDAALRQSAQQISVPDDYLSEISLAARGLVGSLCERMDRGTLLFIDYGFGAGEYYHPQRSQGTLMCHYRHHAHDDPFFLPGLQDITAHVNFTAIAEGAADSGAHLLGYTTQAHFLINCGITDFLAESEPEKPREYLPLSAQLQRLTSPAEMGELFKVIALGKGIEELLSGFARGDRSRSL